LQAQAKYLTSQASPARFSLMLAFHSIKAKNYSMSPEYPRGDDLDEFAFQTNMETC
jgi:hypothetical protein